MLLYEISLFLSGLAQDPVPYNKIQEIVDFEISLSRVCQYIQWNINIVYIGVQEHNLLFVTVNVYP